MDFITGLLTVFVVINPTQSYEEIYLEAYTHCVAPYQDEEDHKNREKVLDNLIEIEKEFFKNHPDVPISLRGMLVASACAESRFNPGANGDFEESQRGGISRRSLAQGVLQLWPWWEKEYGINRYDPIASSRAFLTHLLNQYRKNKENNSCPTNFSNEQKWVAAWSQTANSTTPPAISRMRCGSNQSPIHYRLLQRWIRAIGEIRIMKNEGC
tara:strand:- start:6103 stop:6738 length:636 start_codon:yes stop_codon:yes gene_type:complete